VRGGQHAGSARGVQHADGARRAQGLAQHPPLAAAAVRAAAGAAVPSGAQGLAQHRPLAAVAGRAAAGAAALSGTQGLTQHPPLAAVAVCAAAGAAAPAGAQGLAQHPPLAAAAVRAAAGAAVLAGPHLAPEPGQHGGGAAAAAALPRPGPGGAASGAGATWPGAPAPHAGGQPVAAPAGDGGRAGRGKTAQRVFPARGLSQLPPAAPTASLVGGRGSRGACPSRDAQFRRGSAGGLFSAGGRAMPAAGPAKALCTGEHARAQSALRWPGDGGGGGPLSGAGVAPGCCGARVATARGAAGASVSVRRRCSDMRSPTSGSGLAERWVRSVRAPRSSAYGMPKSQKAVSKLHLRSVANSSMTCARAPPGAEHEVWRGKGMK